MEGTYPSLKYLEKKKRNLGFQLRKNPSLKNFFFNFLNKPIMNFIYVLFPKIPVPTIFAWDVEGPTVYVSGDWDGWRGTIPLCPSELDFSGLIPLYPGEYIYKFSVDGKWKYATITKIEKNFQGTFNNSSAITRLWEFLYPDDSLLEKIIFQDTFFSDFESQNLKRYNRKTSTMPPHYIAFF
mmetsp:Transcript_37467/g.91063  ORF Transcript_37467/g.91063 Transcript_37467/m.91063 type:complete len:182 (+) Transcript_37467:3056-3601(+)